MSELDDTMEKELEESRKIEEPMHELLKEEGIEQTDRVFDGKPEINKKT